ncbi:MAG: ribosomal RNA small subunit methyltransferase A, partial [Chloroflexota bacterium]
PGVLDALLARSSIRPGDLVYEVGPGLGAITTRLAALGSRVVAIEADRNLARRLAGRLAGHTNVAIHLHDFLAFPLPEWEYKLFANPPFNCTSALIRRLFIEAEHGPDDAYLVMQSAAAERLLGTPRQSLLGLMVQPWYDVALFHRFARGDFLPAPGVDVVMLRLSKRGPPLIPLHQAVQFRAFATRMFNRGSHQLGQALRPVFGGPSAGSRLDPALNLRRPASHVQLDQWVRLFRSLNDGQDFRGAPPR